MHDVAAIVPIKTNNQRLPGKNTRKICGVPLFRYLFSTLQLVKTVSKVFVDSSDEYILSEAKNFGFTPIRRPEHLNARGIQGNDLLEFELQIVQTPIVIQLFVTSPFIKAEKFVIDSSVYVLLICISKYWVGTT